MFADQVSVYVKAGDGGNGLASFHREKYVPLGGPSGGDGGQGGNIVFTVDEGLNTLIDFRYNRHYKAKRGEDGKSKSQHGKNAAAYDIAVPPGTTIYDEDTEEVIADLTTHGQSAIIANGGRGGRGNIHFASSRNPAPNLSENGEPGEEKNIRVELKVMADVGIVGFPSVGKSTLLSVSSKAKPKIAGYHFTTLQPNLGVVDTEDDRSFVMADLPGLIEGAHEGVGLGYQFLRHVERTRIIMHVLDMAATEARDPYEDYETINEELRRYNRDLEKKQQIIVANKMDMPGAEENLAAFKKKLADDIPVFPISTLTKAGLRELHYHIADVLETIPKETEQEEQVIIEHKPQKEAFVIHKLEADVYELTGPKVEKLFKMTDFSSDEAVKRFSRQLRHMGVDKALRERGANDGDTIRLSGFEFEFIE
ncbi:MAG TPA: GTPase ObgE [Pseudogracilibacillus sp.]|nr:GTPase ObgE [Pseudogracilibacillus sp.]